MNGQQPHGSGAARAAPIAGPAHSRRATATGAVSVAVATVAAGLAVAFALVSSAAQHPGAAPRASAVATPHPSPAGRPVTRVPGPTPARGQVGDFNGDGLADTVVAGPADGADADGSQVTHSAVVVLGTPHPANVDLRAVKPPAVIPIRSTRSLGEASLAGDIDGDGLADVWVTATPADPSREARYPGVRPSQHWTGRPRPRSRGHAHPRGDVLLDGR